MRHPMTLIARPAIVLALLTGFLAPATIPVSSAEPDRAAANFEIRFLQEMIDHHAIGAEIARAGEGKPVHAELSGLLDRIETRQGLELRQMRAWLEKWYGIRYEPRFKSADQRRIERLALMNGAEFEIALLDLMIEHHREAVSDAALCTRGGFGDHDELRALCEEMIAARNAEIDTLQAWLCRWHRRC